MSVKDRNSSGLNKYGYGLENWCLGSKNVKEGMIFYKNPQIFTILKKYINMDMI
jgi:hypothetical protein